MQIRNHIHTKKLYLNTPIQHTVNSKYSNTTHSELQILYDHSIRHVGSMYRLAGLQETPYTDVGAIRTKMNFYCLRPLVLG